MIYYRYSKGTNNHNHNPKGEVTMNENKISLDPEFTDEEWLAMMVGSEEEFEQEYNEEMKKNG